KKNRPIDGFRNGHALWIAIGIHILLAVVYTTPWDNYLVATGVWYYNPELVAGWVIGYVPIEEYTFFVLETILAGLWWWILVRRLSRIPSSGFTPNRLLIYLTTCLLAALWLISAYLFFFGAPQWTYLSIILFWALPALIMQMLFGADILWHYRTLVAWAILVPGVYLSLMDIVALQATTWSISTSQTTGILFFGILPLEEVVFFFITNTLLTFGLTLLLADVSRERLTEIRKQVRAWRERQRLDPQQR
ncbi:MAG TPA: lycopene cyclase domain-containing protein, partial [Anaerolineales bacterium]|nr:lycopene cyclase domain-containing protein [Anaerolineales bacterium]